MSSIVFYVFFFSFCLCLWSFKLHPASKSRQSYLFMRTISSIWNSAGQAKWYESRNDRFNKHTCSLAGLAALNALCCVIKGWVSPLHNKCARLLDVHATLTPCCQRAINPLKLSHFRLLGCNWCTLAKMLIMYQREKCCWSHCLKSKLLRVTLVVVALFFNATFPMNLSTHGWLQNDVNLLASRR